MKIDINHIFRSLIIAAIAGVSFFVATQALALRTQEAKNAALHDCALTSRVRYESNASQAGVLAQTTEVPAENIYTKCVSDKGYSIAQ